jgi:hypothetical protein
MKPIEKLDKQIKQLTLPASSDLDRRIDSLIDESIASGDRVSMGRGKGAYTPIVKLAVAATVLVAVLLGMNHIGGSLDGTSVAWADIVDQFRSMSFYNAVFYFKEDAAAEAQQLELWVSKEHTARLRVDKQVLFVDQGRIVAGFDFKNKAALVPEQYNARGEAIVQKICQQPQLSLESMVKLLHQGQLQETTPQINSDAMISQDLLVFDVQSGAYPGWMRIWALRESKLPVRLRMWDPRDGSSMDVMVTYDKEQPEAFFDPNRYEDLINTAGHVTSRGNTNLAYAFLKDPGGRDYVPRDLFERSGYHLPQVDRVGMTDHGAVWVIASRSQNRRPDGHTFYGFSAMTDNLGRTYRRMNSSWHISDVSTQMFVPEGYPFGSGMPETITLTCDVEQWHSREPKVTVGTRTITQWQQNAPLPNRDVHKSENSMLLSAAYGFCKSQDFDTLDRVVAIIEASPDADQDTHKLQQLQLAVLMQRQDFASAATLAEQLWPVEMDHYNHPRGFGPKTFSLLKCVAAIAASGQVDRAEALFKQIKATRPDLSRFSKQWRTKMVNDLQAELSGRDMGPIISDEFMKKAKLSLEQINRIFGFDVSQNDETKWSLPQEFTNPDIRAWDAHLKQLAEHYGKYPLEPGQMELRVRETRCNGISNVTPPGLDDYRVNPMAGTLKDYATYQNYPDSLGRVKFQAGLETELEKIELQHELVRRGEVSREKKRALVLGTFGVEMVAGEDECRVWIADYDGRPLPDYQEVKPLTQDGSLPGGRQAWSSGGMSLSSLFKSLRDHQGIVVENNTGLDDDTKLSMITLNFRGPVGAEQAEQWYQDNFGITFRKEMRRMSVWIVRKK